MCAQVYRVDRRCIEREHRFLQRRRLTDHRQDRSIVRSVRRMVEHSNTRVANGVDQGGYDIGAPAFADVRHALDDRHE